MDGFPELRADLLRFVDPLIFDRIVKETGDGLILAAAVLDNEASDRQEMGDVGDLGSLPGLLAMEAGRVHQCLAEAGRQRIVEILVGGHRDSFRGLAASRGVRDVGNTTQMF